MAVTTKVNSMGALQRAFNAESYAYLEREWPEILAAIEAEISNGHTPEEIKRFALQWTCRFEMAMRCYQAAKHVTSMAA